MSKIEMMMMMTDLAFFMLAEQNSTQHQKRINRDKCNANLLFHECCHRGLESLSK